MGNHEHHNKTIWTAIANLRQDLAQEQQANAANTETLRILKGVIRRHCHEPIPEFEDTAALENTGSYTDPGPYAPVSGIAPEGAWVSDRYDAAHPESGHDGGLGSGDWMKEREA